MLEARTEWKPEAQRRRQAVQELRRQRATKPKQHVLAKINPSHRIPHDNAVWWLQNQSRHGVYHRFNRSDAAM